jgi:hypothetical protein
MGGVYLCTPTTREGELLAVSGPYPFMTNVPGLDTTMVGRDRVTPAVYWVTDPRDGKRCIATCVVETGEVMPVYDFNDCCWCILFGVLAPVFEMHSGMRQECKASRGVP